MAEPTRETVVVTDGGGGGSAGAIVAIVALLVIAVVGYLLYTNGVFSGGGKDTNIDVKIESPVGGSPSK